jgi:Flp pilus assembly secretin CpaC
MTCLNRIARAALVVATTVALAGVAAADAQTLTRLYLSKDKSQLVDLREPAAKVAVTNPGIADVQVISPNQILVMGRAVGVTSMVVFSDKAVRNFDVVVHPSPMGEVAAQPLRGAPHGVLVQRGDKLTEHYFTRDTSQQWVELGSVKVETEAGKK